MYYYLNGTVAELTSTLAVIDCGGVGYACHASGTTLHRLEKGKQAKLFTYLNVREDALDLFGFYDMEELSCFKMLLSISGVGPKVALAILSSATPEQLALSVISGEEKTLTAAPGVGKKLASRIILELKDKVAKGHAGAYAELPGAAAIKPSGSGAVYEAVSALMVLGYSKAEANEALRGVSVDGMTVESLLREALKRLAR